MRDILPTLERWLEEGHRFALATVIQTWGSSPRPVGSVMGIRDDGLSCGSVSGGCIESSVIADAIGSMAAGSTIQVHFGSVSDDEALEVGLSCGGEVKVLIEPGASGQVARWAETASALKAGGTVVRSVDLESGAVELLSPDTHRGELPVEVVVEGHPCFVNIFRDPDHLLIVGAVHIAQALVRYARMLDFRVTVVDPRSAFTDPARFDCDPNGLLTAWPQDALPNLGINDRTYAVLLSHDPKIDDPALRILLQSEAAYIGALGSTSTQALRKERMESEGFDAKSMSRIHGPVGLDIGAKTPAEIALSIISEIVQVKRGKG